MRHIRPRKQCIAEALERRRLFDAPVLAWSSYLGGTDFDYDRGIAIDDTGNAWVTGQTQSLAWAVDGFDTSYNGGGDAFIAKIDANGTLAWSSYLGGTSGEVGFGIAIDGSGNAWVTGSTGSSGWAMGGFDTSYNGGGDAFIAKIDADGSLAWSTYLGGTGDDRGYGIAIDGSGNACVTGHTFSSGWTVGGFDTSFNGGSDDFIAKINANGTLAWSSYLGGTSFDYSDGGIALDGSGNAWVTGFTSSSGWAVGGFDTNLDGGADAFIAKINANGTLAWSSYLGGSSFDEGHRIAIDGSDNAWVTGATNSVGWAVGGFDTTINSSDGSNDAFIAKINANGTLAWSSYLGGPSSDGGSDIGIDGSGNAWVTGWTAAGGWAVGGFDTSYNGGDNDAFIARINADGTLAWSSYVGGTGVEFGYGIAIDGAGNAWVSGSTNSSGWAVGGFDTSYNGGGDGFVAKVIDDVTPPSVTTANFAYETAPNSVRLTFSEDVFASLSADDLIVTTVPGGAPVEVTGFAYDVSTNTATFALLTPMPNGDYEAVLAADSVHDPSGNPLADDYTLPFFVFAGDADHNGTINFDDYARIDNGFNNHLIGFINGDFNYDGVINFDDYAIIDLAFNNQRSAGAQLGRVRGPRMESFI